MPPRVARVHAWAGTDPARNRVSGLYIQKHVQFYGLCGMGSRCPHLFSGTLGQKMVLAIRPSGTFSSGGVELPTDGRTYATPGDWQLHLTTVFSLGTAAPLH